VCGLRPVPPAGLAQRLIEDHAGNGPALASVDDVENRNRQAVDGVACDLGDQLQAFAFTMLDGPLRQLAEVRRVRRP
jgi:hypothetical protein